MAHHEEKMTKDKYPASSFQSFSSNWTSWEAIVGKE